MSVDAKFIRDIDQYFKYPTDENPTTQQQYQEAVRNWVTTEEAIVDSHLWQPTTSYSVGNQVRTPSLPPQYVLVCTTAGVSGSGEPDYENVGVGDSVTDGTAEWLVSEALTSAGGTMGGDIEWNGINDDTFAVGMSDANNDNVDIGWKYNDKTGAGIGLRNITHNDGGAFNIWATDGTNVTTLVGKADGTLRWNSLDITPRTLSTTAFNEKNVASGTRTNLGSFTLTKGTWLITATCQFQNNSNGYRYLGISSSSTGDQINRFSSVTCSPSSGIGTHIIFSTIHAVSANTTLYLNVYQTSGSTLSTSNSGVRLFRLSHDA